MIRLLPFLVFYVSLLIGCSGGFLVKPYTDPDFKPYIEQFNSDYKTYTGKTSQKQISMVYGVLDEYTAGYCNISTHLVGLGTITNYEIVIDRNYWERSGDCNRMILIYHELGHCELGRMHNEESIMEPFLISCSRFKEDKEYYLKELFGVEK